MCCPVSHILQDQNPFTEPIRFLPLLLVAEEMKKCSSKQSEFEDRNRMGFKILIFLLVEGYNTKHPPRAEQR